MNNLFKSTILISSSLCLLLLTGCQKDTSQKITASALHNSVASELTGSDSIRIAINAYDILGEYSTRGSRTVYNGQANSNGDNIKLSIDFFGVKKILPSPDKRHLTCPFGEGKYVERGWKYIIGYDFKNKKITLAPNDIMAAAIVPGSFEALYADYNAAFNSFTFQTRFTALEDKGDESEVIEPLAKN